MEILRYTYDNMDRLLTTTVERDGAEPVLLCSNTYDDLGRLATQSLGGTAEGSHAIIRTVPLMVIFNFVPGNSSYSFNNNVRLIYNFSHQ